MNYYYSPAQNILHSQGLGARSTQVRNKFLRKWAVWLILVTGLLLFYVWSRVRLVQVGYEVTELERKTQALSKEAQGLELEIAGLKSPKRLKEIAEKRLNMRPPTAEQIILVKP